MRWQNHKPSMTKKETQAVEGSCIGKSSLTLTVWLTVNPLTVGLGLMSNKMIILLAFTILLQFQSVSSWMNPHTFSGVDQVHCQLFIFHPSSALVLVFPASSFLTHLLFGLLPCRFSLFHKAYNQRIRFTMKELVAQSQMKRIESIKAANWKQEGVSQTSRIDAAIHNSEMNMSWKGSNTACIAVIPLLHSIRVTHSQETTNTRRKHNTRRSYPNTKHVVKRLFGESCIEDLGE